MNTDNTGYGYLFLCITFLVPFLAGVGATILVQRLSGVIRRAWEDLTK